MIDFPEIPYPITFFSQPKEIGEGDLAGLSQTKPLVYIGTGTSQ